MFELIVYLPLILISATLSKVDTDKVSQKQVNTLHQAASITSYPASIRTTIIRMMVSDAVQAKDLKFDRNTTDMQLSKEGYVFQGTAYQNIGGITEGENKEQWFYNANFQIKNIGTTGPDGNDLIAFLPHLKKDICEKINREFGIQGIPEINNINEIKALKSTITSEGEGDSAFPSNETKTVVLETANGSPYGCFYQPDAGHVYYHVLIER